jgi:hypothetical protein
MNPLVEKDSGRKSYFGRHILGMIREKPKPWNYSVMKKKKIAKRRAKNKVARRSRRINKLRME